MQDRRTAGIEVLAYDRLFGSSLSCSPAGFPLALPKSKFMFIAEVTTSPAMPPLVSNHAPPRQGRLRALGSLLSLRIIFSGELVIKIRLKTRTTRDQS